jgi:uncharacterized membrane-anchored protein YhcB (DUF1043 family)
MVNINRSESNQLQAIDQLRAQVKPDECNAVLHRLTGQRGMGLDDEALEFAGTYAHAARVAESFNIMLVAMPKLYEDTVEKTQLKQKDRDESMIKIIYQLQEQVQAQFAENAKMLEASAKRLISQSRAGRLQPWGYGAIGVSVGLTLGTLISFFILFPNQLRQARVGDGAILEWLATPDGRLLYRTFKSGNRSVQACVKKAGAQSKGTKSLVCQITLN